MRCRAVRCDVLYVVWYSLVWCGMVRCFVAWCCEVLCGVAWCGAVRNGMVWCGEVCCVVLCFVECNRSTTGPVVLHDEL